MSVSLDEIMSGVAKRTTCGAQGMDKVAAIEKLGQQAGVEHDT